MDAEERRLVVFDTNVIESRYLAPLLRGERCRDLSQLRRWTPAYCPAIHVKTYYEICQHAKLGKKQFPWCSRACAYPGGLATGRDILEGLPDAGGEPNLYWWFNMAEEWRAIDWADEEARVRSLATPLALESALAELDVRRRFVEWKSALTSFCKRIWEVLDAEVKILTPHDVYGSRGERLDAVFALDQDLAHSRLVPNEDAEIVVAALACQAAAFVTADKEILSCSALTLSLNSKTAFVHVDRLEESLSGQFETRWSGKQTSPRGTDG